MARKSTKSVALSALLESARVTKDGTRKLSVKKTIHDATGQALAACQTVTDFVALAKKHGIAQDVVENDAKRAPNFGQFRMVVGNRIRAAARRAEFAVA